MPPVDHRRAIAERNATAILDATERLLARHAPLSIAAVAAEAGVSRPTLYAHHATLAELVEAAVLRAVAMTLAAVEAAKPDDGPAPAAVDRMLAASWAQLARLEAFADTAAEHLSAAHVQRTHAPLMERLAGVVERGQREGAFRTDLPAAWLVPAFYALVHTADELARGGQMPRDDALAMLTTSVHDLFGG